MVLQLSIPPPIEILLSGSRFYRTSLNIDQHQNLSMSSSCVHRHRCFLLSQDATPVCTPSVLERRKSTVVGDGDEEIVLRIPTANADEEGSSSEDEDEDEEEEGDEEDESENEDISENAMEEK